MKIFYRHRAEIALAMIHAWGTAEFDKKYADRFVSKLLREIRRLSNHPELGILITKEVTDSNLPLRSLVIHEYFKAIYYFDKKQDIIIVVHIVDVRQDTDI